jgi:hypothetical protein
MKLHRYTLLICFILLHVSITHSLHHSLIKRTVTQQTFDNENEINNEIDPSDFAPKYTNQNRLPLPIPSKINEITIQKETSNENVIDPFTTNPPADSDVQLSKNKPAEREPQTCEQLLEIEKKKVQELTDYIKLLQEPAIVSADKTNEIIIAKSSDKVPREWIEKYFELDTQLEEFGTDTCSDREKQVILQLIKLFGKQKFIIRENIKLKSSNPCTDIRGVICENGKLIGLHWPAVNSDVWKPIYVSNLHLLTTLTNLKYLNLAQNGLSELPEFTNLKSLQSLNLNGNRLMNLETMKDLITLKYVDFNNNRFLNLPDMHRWESIITLKIGGTSYKKKKITFENLSTLVILDISNNKMNVLPNLCSLKKLKYFIGNRLRLGKKKLNYKKILIFVYLLKKFNFFFFFFFFLL